MDDTLKAEIAFQVPGLRGVGCMAVTDDITVTGLSNRSGTTQPAPTRNQPEQYCLAVGGKSESVEVFHIAATRMKDEADASANVEKKPSGTTPRAGRRRGSIFTWFGRTGRTSSASSIRRITGGMPLVRASLMKSGGYRASGGIKRIEKEHEERLAACASVISILGVDAHLEDHTGWDSVKPTRMLRAELVSPAVACALDPTGELLATANEARIIHLWSIRRGASQLREVRQEFPLLPEVEFRSMSSISSLSFSGDAKRLVVATLEHTEIYDVEEHSDVLDAVKARQRENLRRARELKQSDRSLLEDDLIYSNRMHDRRSTEYDDHDSEGRASIYGRGASESSLGAHDKPAFNLLPSIYLDRAIETGMAVHANTGGAIAIAGSHHITVFDASIGSSMMQVPSEGRVRCVAISKDGEFIVAGTNNKQVLLFTIASGAEMTVLPPTRSGFDTKVPFSPPPRSPTVLSGDRPDAMVGSIARESAMSDEPSAGSFMGPRSWNMSVVRSVCVSASESMLAMGSDNQGVGLVEMYDIVKASLAWCRVRDDGAVWCVRLSPDDRVLAAGGHTAFVVLYAAESGDELLSIRSEPRPDEALSFAFVWTLGFSADGSRFAYGSWAGVVQVFDFSAETTVTSRSFLAAGGGGGDGGGSGGGGGGGSVDPLDPGPDAETVMTVKLEPVTSVLRADRVYAIALSEDGKKLICGGRDKHVALFTMEELTRAEAAGEDPEPVWELPSSDYIYCVASTPDMEYCAFGGSNNTCTVVRGKTGERIFQVTSDAVVWSVALVVNPHVNIKIEGWHRQAHQAIDAETSQEAKFDADVLVAIGGEATGIRVIEIASRKEVLHLPADETTFSVCLTPSVLAFTTGNRATVFGKGGDHYAWHEQPSFDIARSIYHRAVLSQHRLENVELLREVLQRHPTTVNQRDPETDTTLVQFACETTSHTDMLHLLLEAHCRKGLGLTEQNTTIISAALTSGRHQALSTVFGALITGQLVVAPGMDYLISNAFMRMAEAAPRELVNFVSKMPLQPEPEILADGIYDTVYLNSMLIIGDERRCPKGVWDEVLENEMHLQHVASGQDNFMPEFLTRKLDAFSQLRRQMPGRGKDKVRESLDSFSSVSAGVHRLQQGFRKSGLGGATAYRVPFENIASDLSAVNNLRVSMLGLIVSAAESTGSMLVFGSKTMEILLHFKWNGFARKAFVHTAIFGLTKAVCFTAFNLLITIQDFDGMHEPLPWSEGSDTPVTAFLVAQLVMIAITSTWCVLDTLDEWQQFRRAGFEAYFGSWFNWLDLTRVGTQLAVNVLFFCRDIPGLGWTRLAYPDYPCKLMPSCGSRDVLFGMQATCFVVLWLYVLYFARADLDFAVLVHVLARVMIDILPFLQLVIFLWLGFAFALSLLFRVQVLTSMQLQMRDAEIMFPEQGDWDFLTWMLHVLNMGLFGHLDDSTLLLVAENWWIKIVYLFYMITMNLVLLNLLIAIMQYSYEGSTKEAKLVAKYRRAKLILEQQHAKQDALNPRWLHVLLPVEKERSGMFAASMEDEITNIRTALDRLQKRVTSESTMHHDTPQ